jgi:hypothetical protein
MKKQRQIKISVSQKAYDLIEQKSKKLGMKKSTYCFNIIFEHMRKELENGGT